MLTTEEAKYLANIDPRRRVFIAPFDPAGEALGGRLVSQIKQKFPNADVRFMGSTALGIAGQKDIDIYLLCPASDFPKYTAPLEQLFGPIAKQGEYLGKQYIEWKFTQEGYAIEIYLTEPPERQIKVFELLRDNADLRAKYAELKLAFNGKSYRDYQRAKYELFNEIIEM